MNLQGKVAWITGGARMGHAVAGVLSQAGCKIVLTFRRTKSPILEIVRELSETGTEVMALPCDVTQRSQIQLALGRMVRRFKRVDILVHLSSLYHEASIENQEDVLKSWKAHMSANAQSSLALSLEVAPWMRKVGGGRIIHVSDWTSASGRPRYKNYSMYYASKATVKALVEALALELAPTILVNGIAPGPILPPAGLSAKDRKAVSQATPLKRWGGAEEIAKTVLFLAQTDFVTGETIRVDGGRHLY